ncbi:DUF6088 family protein [Parasphaerochaeta coccoides]|uniref:Transcriptional regulator, AbiEi antitoxin, Type IV TA system n=1 Tax=Parasphaerochaeta coccoides (strain ATCC BAA-1237 / DSM 17374 / SPN1) TaxID=760011 RepID=F4GL21_PARC1|nr:DUF6088 family protein [Parasphaerochaeta coccoides]AEC02361.1 hypothetical protein Spico_1144 [Parasphaerochaeta coccoides DSM 17374]
MKSRVEEIRSQIQRMNSRSIFFADDFGMDDRQAVRVILSRLAKDNTIVRLGAGIYMKPRYSNLIHSIEYPSVGDIAQAVAQKEKARIVPSGAYAVHRLGLSTQIPTRAIFLTDGSPRKMTLEDGREIIFKRTAAKNLAYKNTTIGIIVSALKEIGAKGIDAETRNLLARLLESVPYDKAREDILIAPEWIQKELIGILRKGSS